MTSASSAQSPLPHGSTRTLRLATVLLSGLLLLVLLAAFPYQHWDVIEYRSSILGGILKKARQDSEWWFCLVTPFIVGWLVWRMKKSLVGLPLQGSWLGIPPLVLGMIFYWFGYKADTAYPGYLAAQLITLGLILQLGGTPWLRRLFFPWAFLVFTWPMLPLETMLAVPLRQMTAQASGILLNLIGVPVMREGTGLFSAADPARSLAQGDLFQLDVEEPCSGIRSLFSLMMLAALYGWLSLKTWPARAILFASAIPLAMLGNLVRMVLLALGSLWFGSDFAIGRNIGGHQEMSFYHSMAGFMVFGVALAGMFGIATLLESRLERHSRASTAAPPPGAAVPARSWLHLGVALGILCGGLAACVLSDSSYQVGPLGLRPEMPGILGPFVSTDQPMTAREKAALAEDVRVERRFYSKPDRAIIATLVLSGAEKRSLHSPEVCLPAQGWKTGETTQIQLDLGLEKEISASLMTMYLDQVDAQGRRGRMRALFIYWYHGSDGTTCASDQQHVLRTYSDAFFKDLNHRWSLLTFFVPLATSTSLLDDPYAELAALEDAKAFIRSLVPSMIVKE
jgi:exosortase